MRCHNTGIDVSQIMTQEVHMMDDYEMGDTDVVALA